VLVHDLCDPWEPVLCDLVVVHPCFPPFLVTSNDGNEKPASFSPKIVTCILDSCNFVADGRAAVEIFVPFSLLQEPTGRPRFCFVGSLVFLFWWVYRCAAGSSSTVDQIVNATENFASSKETTLISSYGRERELV